MSAILSNILIRKATGANIALEGTDVAGQSIVGQPDSYVDFTDVGSESQLKMIVDSNQRMLVTANSTVVELLDIRSVPTGSGITDNYPALRLASGYLNALTDATPANAIQLTIPSQINTVARLEVDWVLNTDANVSVLSGTTNFILSSKQNYPLSPTIDFRENIMSSTLFTPTGTPEDINLQWSIDTTPAFAINDLFKLAYIQATYSGAGNAYLKYTVRNLSGEIQNNEGVITLLPVNGAVGLPDISVDYPTERRLTGFQNDLADATTVNVLKLVIPQGKYVTRTTIDWHFASNDFDLHKSGSVLVIVDGYMSGTQQIAYDILGEGFSDLYTGSGVEEYEIDWGVDDSTAAGPSSRDVFITVTYNSDQVTPPTGTLKFTSRTLYGTFDASAGEVVVTATNSAPTGASPGGDGDFGGDPGGSLNANAIVISGTCHTANLQVGNTSVVGQVLSATDTSGNVALTSDIDVDSVTTDAMRFGSSSTVGYVLKFVDTAGTLAAQPESVSVGYSGGDLVPNSANVRVIGNNGFRYVDGYINNVVAEDVSTNTLKIGTTSTVGQLVGALDTSGNVGLLSTNIGYQGGNLIPTTTQVSDVGSASKEFLTVYGRNGVYTGIVAVNTLEVGDGTADYTFPSQDSGNVNDVLTTNGSGQLVFRPPVADPALVDFSWSSLGSTVAFSGGSYEDIPVANVNYTVERQLLVTPGLGHVVNGLVVGGEYRVVGTLVLTPGAVITGLYRLTGPATQAVSMYFSNATSNYELKSVMYFTASGTGTTINTQFQGVLPAAYVVRADLCVERVR